LKEDDGSSDWHEGLLLAFCSASSVDEVEQLKRDVAGAGMKLAFTCLSDTVDPRGPKGK
jgi:hypothetical protein